MWKQSKHQYSNDSFTDPAFFKVHKGNKQTLFVYGLPPFYKVWPLFQECALDNKTAQMISQNEVIKKLLSSHQSINQYFVRVIRFFKKEFNR